ncbi:MAG TPA: hypothetical protein VLB27_09920 [candidate division Zixibacteria bacterium]|nr:hypothetical protein [candidate division Zixibacteria bacterium]
MTATRTASRRLCATTALAGLTLAALAACSGGDTSKNDATDSARVKVVDSSYVSPENTLILHYGIGAFTELEQRFAAGYALCAISGSALTPATASGSLENFEFDWSGAAVVRLDSATVILRPPVLIVSADKTRYPAPEITLNRTRGQRRELTIGPNINLICEIAHSDSSGIILVIGFPGNATR